MSLTRQFITNPGNTVAVRTSVTGGRVQASADYYPYGTPFADGQGLASPTDRRLFGDKELIRFNSYNTYDYTARQYPAAAATFDTPDPLCEQHPWISNYTFCSGNPIARIDPSGMTDYYNLKGNHVKNIDDGIDEKYILISNTKKSEEIDKLIEDGSFILVPGENVMRTFDKVYESTKENNHEYGFVISNTGNVSDIVEGDGDSVSGELLHKEGEKFRSQGQSVAHDVHSHPIIINEEIKVGNDYKFKADEASPEDRDSGGNRVNMILSYEVKIRYSQPANTIGISSEGKFTTTYEKKISFYNPKETIKIGGENSIPYSKLVKAIQKINKLK